MGRKGFMKWGVVFVGVLALGAGILMWRDKRQEEVGRVPSPLFADQRLEVSPQSILLDRMFVGAEAAWGVPMSGSVTEVCASRGIAEPFLVLPHYAPVGRLMRETIQAWKQCASHTPRRLVVISPDHRGVLASGVGTSALAYHLGAESWSMAQEDGEALREAWVREMGHMIGAEHGMGVPLAMTLSEFPSTESVVPLVVSARATQAELRAIEGVLHAWKDEGETLFVLSVDFSHYLALGDAQERDRASQEWLERGQGERFWHANDAYTDNGKGLWLMLRLTDGARWHRAGYQTSVDVGGTPSNVSTFFFGWWERFP